MGRTIPLLLLRASAILSAGLLLLGVFSLAHAASYDGDSYGLSPLPPASQAAESTATNFGGTPTSGGFMPASGGAAPAYSAPSNAALANPASNGFAPAPATQSANAAPAPLAPDPGFAPAPVTSGPPAYRTAAAGGYPAYQPAPAPATQAPLPSSGPPADYGFKPDTPAARPVAQADLVPTPKTALRQAADASTPYGYNRGDGEVASTAPAPGAQAYYQQPFQPADNSPRDNHDYALGSGDKVHLTVFDEADLSGDYTVDGSGYVRLPLIGQIHAAGLTPPQLEAAIGSALANGYLRSPRISVEVVTYRPFYVIGAVGRPGEYPFVNHMNVLNAVAMAGGFLPSAVESYVFLRPQGSAQEYRVRADALAAVNPGDVVRVETTAFWDAMSLFSPLTGVAGIAAAGIRY